MDLAERAMESIRFDGLAEAEKLTGKSYKEDGVTTGMGLALTMANNKRTRELLSEMGDTYMGMSWAEFLAVIADYGFELVMQRRFEYRFDPGDEVVNPDQIVAAHRQKRLLLHATSYVHASDNELVNSGYVYGYARPSEGDDDQWRSFEGCSHGMRSDGKVEFSKDVREALVMTLDRIESVCSFVDWHDPDPFLWLVNYAQEEVPGYNYKQIRDEHLEAMPDWVRGFIL